MSPLPPFPTPLDVDKIEILMSVGVSVTTPKFGTIEERTRSRDPKNLQGKVPGVSRLQSVTLQ